ncbi:MAG: hypothetical protein QOH89_1433 [Pseudonocardiales bacterium]|nr:hypothetical protein [Pseudonocardiales bacterium]
MSRFRDATGRTRSGLRRALRNGVSHVGPLDRAADRTAERRQNHERLLALYETLRSNYAADEVPAAEDLPSGAEIDAVQAAALRPRMYEAFFTTLSAEGDFDRASVALTRKLVARTRRFSAASIAQVFQRYEGLGPIADICLAICALDYPMPDTAWQLLARNDLDRVLRLVPEEYVRLAFVNDPDAATLAVRALLDGSAEGLPGPESWLNVAYDCLSADQPALAVQVLDRAAAAAGSLKQGPRLRDVNARLTTLRDWVGRAEAARTPVTAPAGTIPFGVVGFKHPNWLEMSQDLDDPLETLAVLGHLLRDDGVELAGDQGLVAAAETLRGDIPGELRRAGQKKTVCLYEVDRDVSRFAAVPDGTWVIVSDWFHLTLSNEKPDIPLNPDLRPLFISFDISPVELAADGAVEYLREHAPIGCSSWDTVFLLHAAGVPAFFSGSIATTVDAVVPRRTGRPTSQTIAVDAATGGSSERRTRNVPRVKARELGENLLVAAEDLRSYRDSGARIVTSKLRFYLAARAVGCSVDFRPAQPGSHHVCDYTSLTDDELQAIQHGITDKLAAVLEAVLAGRPDAEVYEIWRTACADEVARVEREFAGISGYPELNFDLDHACQVVRAAAVTIERTAPAPKGDEVNVEFSLDGNYTHQLDVVLDSVVQHCSRPVRAFLLCRGLDPAHFARTARLFPTVSFVWLPTQDVDYGRIGGMNPWVTPATMDRTILPALLEDVHRIVHFDLDALCLGDLAELFDVDMEGTAIAGATTPQPRFLSGFHTFRRNAERLRKEGHPELARELVLRTHQQHTFDFDVFNAGIMLLDLDKMRADDFCGRHLPNVQRFGLNGQVVLNTYVGGARKVVGNEWNRLIRLEATREANGVHWVGQFKPWRSDLYVTGRELWQAQEERFAERAREHETAGPAGS